eukprot:UN16487
MSSLIYDFRVRSHMVSISFDLFEFEITQNLASTIYQCSPSAAPCIPPSDLLS